MNFPRLPAPFLNTRQIMKAWPLPKTGLTLANGIGGQIIFVN